MSALADEMAVRAYLRALAGAPVGCSARLEALEEDFVASASRWAARNRVDRRVLHEFGVPKTVLDQAGMVRRPAADLVRDHYSGHGRSVGALAQLAGVSEATVRITLAEDEPAGRVARAAGGGRSVLWRVGRRARA